MPQSGGARMDPGSVGDASEASTGHERTVRERYMLRLGYRSLKLRISSMRECADERIKGLPSFDPCLSPGRTGRPEVVVSDDQAPLLQHPPADVAREESGAFVPTGSKPFLGRGSMLSSVFNLSSAALGAGILALPYAVCQSGIVLGLIFLAVAAYVTMFSIQLLVRCRDETRLSTYEDLAVLCFGKRLSVIVDVSIILFCFGTCVAYIVAAYDIVSPIVRDIFPNHPVLFAKPTIMITVVTTIMFPLSLVDKMSSLRFPSFIGVLSICYLVFAVVCDSAYTVVTKGVPPLSPYLIRMHWSCFRSISIIMFAFTCQVNVFSIYTELQRPSIRRIKKIVRRSTLITFSLYVMIGLFGFLRNLDSTQPDILYNYSLLQNPLIGVGQLAMGVTVALAFPFNVYPCRFTIEMSLFADSRPSKSRFNIITAAIVFSALAIAIFVPSLDRVFSLLGSTTSAFVSFVLPALFYRKIFPGPWQRPDRLAATCLLVAGAAVGIIGTAVDVFNIS